MPFVWTKIPLVLIKILAAPPPSSSPLLLLLSLSSLLPLPHLLPPSSSTLLLIPPPSFSSPLSSSSSFILPPAPSSSSSSPRLLLPPSSSLPPPPPPSSSLPLLPPPIPLARSRRRPSLSPLSNFSHISPSSPFSLSNSTLKRAPLLLASSSHFPQFFLQPPSQRITHHLLLIPSSLSRLLPSLNSQRQPQLHPTNGPSPAHSSTSSPCFFFLLLYHINLQQPNNLCPPPHPQHHTPHLLKPPAIKTQATPPLSSATPNKFRRELRRIPINFHHQSMLPDLKLCRSSDFHNSSSEC